MNKEWYKGYSYTIMKSGSRFQLTVYSQNGGISHEDTSASYGGAVRKAKSIINMYLG